MKPILVFFAWAASAVVLQAQVQVDFAHSYTGAAGANQNTGDITLTFTVDGSGAVTLDASSANATPATYVDEFDGLVGSVTDPAMWGQSFSIVLSNSGAAGTSLRIDNTGDGLAVQGNNPQLIDAANEQLTATVTAAGASFKLLGIGFTGAAGSPQMNVAGTSYPLSGASGTVDVASQGVTGTFTIGSAANSNSQGFVLRGLTFDFPGSPLTATDVEVSFANSGTGFGPTPPWVGSGGGTQTITLTFDINGAGVVLLDASTNSTNTVFKNTVDEWDSANVGAIDDPALLNQSFTLVGSPSGGSGGLSITENNGGGIGIQGENSNRIDGLNYGTDNLTSTPETLTWTLTAPAGLQLNLVDWSHADGAGGDIRVSSGPAGQNFPNLAAAAGTSALTGISLTNGGSLTFREITDVGLTSGAAIAGFSFSVTAASGDSGFNNGSGNNLWTTASNWNPNGLPVAPNDAIINGFHVILNSPVTTGPAGLQILDGSLTIRGTGSVSVASMSLGEVFGSEAQLVIEGSTASLGHTGSGTFTVGSSATVVTIPDNSGSSPLELDSGNLVLKVGYEWILDGSNYSGTFNVGDKFFLANFGTLTGPSFGSGNEDGFTNTAGFRTRNFDLPTNRKLQLVETATSIYYEVVAQTAVTGPNIIIVNVDDMAGGQHFGFDGRDVITPTLDSLVSTGLRFTSGFAASTVCGPSRYSLMTGRWASRNTSAQFIARYPLNTLGRFAVADTELENDNQNLGAWLQQAGYRTGLVGKGHFTDDDLNQTSNWAAKGLLTYPQNSDPKTDATTNAKMKHNHRVLCQRMRAFGFDYVSSYYKANLAELRNEALNVHNQEWITKGALDFIEENHDERFFLYMAPTINHGPVRDDLTKTLLADKGYTSAGYLPNEDYSFMPTRTSIVNQVTGAGKARISARETWLDYSIQAIINKLTAHGIRNDTLIIFTSDHGEKTLPGVPLVWGKSSLYDLGMKVPLVMNWPNGITSPGRIYDEIVSHVDLAPTLLALTGASNLPTRPVDGVNLAAVLNGSSAAVRDDLFCEIGYARAVRTKDRKYIAVRYTPSVYTQIANGFRWQKYDSNTPLVGQTVPRPYYVSNTQLGSQAANTNPTYFDDDQLYNLTTDPGENTNLYGQDPATAYDLKKRLADHMGDIPNRPFRQFSDSSREFSPAPTAAPQPPQSLQLQFQGVNQVKLDWTDAANSELGYIVEKSINGGPFQIIAEMPSGVTTRTVPVDAGVEDIVLQVSAYNALGNTAAANPVDLLTPASWRFRTFGDVDPNLTAPLSQWSTDADGDGQTNLWEYAFGTNPRQSSSVTRCEGQITVQGENSFLEYRVPRDARREVTITGSVSENLSAWSRGAPACVVAEEGPTHRLYRSTTAVDDQPRQFMRAEIDEP